MLKLYKISVQYKLVGVFTMLMCFYSLQYSQTYLTKENVGIKCSKNNIYRNVSFIQHVIFIDFDLDAFC